MYKQIDRLDKWIVFLFYKLYSKLVLYPTARIFSRKKVNIK